MQVNFSLFHITFYLIGSDCLSPSFLEYYILLHVPAMWSYFGQILYSMFSNHFICVKFIWLGSELFGDYAHILYFFSLSHSV